MIAALYIDPRGPYPRMAEICPRDGTRGCECADCPPIDCWDATRDARKYDGLHPVVAHPPCKHWGRLRHLAKDAECAACEGDGCAHYRTGDSADRRCPVCHGAGRVSDRDCAPRAVEQVRAFGGVLEHPARSLLWMHGPTCPGTASGAHCKHAADGDGPCCKCGWEHLPLPDHAEDSFGGYTIELDQVEWGHVARKRTWLYLVGVPREALEAPPFPGREPTHRIGSSTCGREDGTRYRPASGLRSASAQQRRRTPPLFAEYLVRLARAVRK